MRGGISSFAEEHPELLPYRKDDILYACRAVHDINERTKLYLEDALEPLETKRAYNKTPQDIQWRLTQAEKYLEEIRSQCKEGEPLLKFFQAESDVHAQNVTKAGQIFGSELNAQSPKPKAADVRHIHMMLSHTNGSMQIFLEQLEKEPPAASSEAYSKSLENLGWRFVQIEKCFEQIRSAYAKEGHSLPAYYHSEQEIYSSNLARAKALFGEESIEAAIRAKGAGTSPSL